MKIKLYESEIKRAVRRKLMERFIDEVEKMDVYKKDEIDLSTVKPGTYGLKDEKGNIKSITVNEEDSDDDMDVTDSDVLQTFATDGTYLGMGYSPVRDMDVDDDYKDKSMYNPYYDDNEEDWDISHIKENISKVKSLNLSKKFKKGLR